MIDPAEYDPLDVRLRGAPHSPGAAALSSRRQVTVSSLMRGMPTVLLLLVGMGLGPNGLGVLTANVRSLLDPALPVALAAMGVLAMLSIGSAAGPERRWVFAATLEALVTAAVVAAGVIAVAQLALPTGADRPWILALCAGVCASASSAFASRRGHAYGTSGASLAERDVLAGILLGGVLIAAVRPSPALSPVWLTIQATGVVVVIAIVGWLLLRGGTSEAEQGVFSAATLLLLGGAADYLSLSALAGGMIAGAIWRWSGGGPAERIERDVAHVQHPLVAFILVVAGAQVEFSSTVLVLAATYALLRTAVKLATGRLVARATAGGSDPGIARALVTPGVFGVAFALNAARALGPDVSTLVSIAVLGTIASQLVAEAGAAEGAG